MIVIRSKKTMKRIEIGINIIVVVSLIGLILFMYEVIRDPNHFPIFPLILGSLSTILIFVLPSIMKVNVKSDSKKRPFHYKLSPTMTETLDSILDAHLINDGYSKQVRSFGDNVSLMIYVKESLLGIVSSVFILSKNQISEHDIDLFYENISSF